MRRYFFFLIVMLICSVSLNAQDDENPESKSSAAQEAANKLANPAAAVGSMTMIFDFNSYNGELASSPQSGFRFTFQPSLPYSFKNGVNLFFRPLIAVNLKQPVYTGAEFTNAGADLADISLDLALGKTFNKKWLGIIGVFASLPTATDVRITSGQMLLGPELAYGRVGKWGSVVLLVTHGWSVTKNEEKGSESITGGQYIYNINLGNAWQITGSPTFAYNHNATKGNKFTFPIGTGIKKTVAVGNMPVLLSVQYYYYIATPDAFGPQHQVRLLVVPVVKLPW